MKSFTLPLLAFALAGCLSGPRPPYVPTPAADLAVSSGASESMPRLAEVDSPTRKTNDLLTSVGADKLEGLKPMNMKMEGMDHSQTKGGHEGMDHSKMHGTPTSEHRPDQMKGMDHSKMHGRPTSEQRPDQMNGMDHSKMPGMKDAGQPAQKAENEKRETVEEMKKLSDEMKKASEELKNKASTPKETPKDQPKDPHSGHGSAAPAVPKS
jgi:hypothetical protein